MDKGNPYDRQRRLFLSVVYAVVGVFASTVIVLVLSASQASGAHRQGLGAAELAADVVGFPLAGGWLAVSLIFGEWRTVHGGQIALVPFISVVVDSLLIFLVWEFIHRKRSRELVSDVLHIYR